MSKKQFTITISIVVVILAAVGGAVWYAQSYKQSQNPPVAENEPEQTASSTTEDIDTSDWLTYRNEEYGFEVRYPETWVLQNTQSGIYIKYQKEWEFGMEEGFSAFGVSVIKENLQEFIESYKSDFLNEKPLTRIINKEVYILANIPATKLTSNNAEGINGNFIFAVYNGKNYLITFDENEERHKEIISTFKFIE